MQKKEVYYTIVVTRKRKKKKYTYNWVFHSSIVVVNTLCVLFHSLLYDICLLFFWLSLCYNCTMYVSLGQDKGAVFH